MSEESREARQMLRDQAKDDLALPPDTSLPEPERVMGEPDEFWEDKGPRCPDCGQRGERHVRLCGYD